MTSRLPTGSLAQRSVELAAVVVWAAIVVYGAYRVNGSLYGIDDADIFFSYAEHMAQGHGIVYSIGIPRVEGYTSTLWMLVAAASFFLGLREEGLLVLSVLMLVATTFTIFRVIDRLQDPARSLTTKVVYIGAVTSALGYISWTTITLMDTGLWSLLLVSMAYVSSVAKPTGRVQWALAALPFVLSPLARPEALLVAPVLAILLILRLRLTKASVWPGVVVLLSVVASGGLLAAFRLWYFGYPLPNTYYAKVSSSLTYNVTEGLVYLCKYLLSGVVANVSTAFAAWLSIAFVFSLVGARDRVHGRLSLFIVAAAALLVLVVPVTTGGDHFSQFRLYQPVFPLLGMLFAIGCVDGVFALTDMVHARRSVAPLSAVLAGAWLILLGTNDSWMVGVSAGSSIDGEFLISRDGQQRGHRLNRVFRPSNPLPSIGVITSGGVARTYGGTIYDLMGLNNSYIAHFAGDRVGIKNHAAFEKDAFFMLPIDILIASAGDWFDERALKQLFRDDRFVQRWSFGNVASARDPSLNYEGFYSKQFLATLEASADYAFVRTKRFDAATRTWVPIAP